MKYLFYLSSFLLVIFTACNDSKCVEADGPRTDYNVDVGAFDKVSVSGPVNLQITQGSTQEVTIRTEPEVYGLMDPRVSNGEFSFGFDNNACWKSGRAIELFITVPDIRRIEGSGTLDVWSNGDLQLSSLTLKVSGSGTVSLQGEVEDQSFNVSGSIDVDNFGFVSTNTNIDVSGSGNFEVQCVERLDIDVSGSATIKYKGNPTIDRMSRGV